MTKQYSFYLDINKCVGCNTCRVACKDFYDLALGQNFRRVLDYEGGSWHQNGNAWHQNIFSYYISLSCNHCSEPACVKACPTKAMNKRSSDGLVVVNQELCVGCRYCEMACPYGSPQFDVKNKVMSKCHGCFNKIEEGRMPVCVESCTQRALDFGTNEQLNEKYKNIAETANIAPLPKATLTHPNFIISSNKNVRPCGDLTGNLQNKSEVK